MESALWCSCATYVIILKTDFLLCQDWRFWDIFLSYVQIFKILHELLFQEQPNMDKAENFTMMGFLKDLFWLQFSLNFSSPNLLALQLSRMVCYSLHFLPKNILHNNNSVKFLLCDPFWF